MGTQYTQTSQYSNGAFRAANPIGISDPKSGKSPSDTASLRLMGSAKRNAGGGKGGARPGVTVSGDKCTRVITLAVFIAAGSDPSGRGKKLLQRAKAILAKLDKFECCPKDSGSCTVKLGLEIQAAPAPGGKKKGPVQARFYNDPKQQRANLAGGGDAFGLTHTDGSIEIPSISEWAANLDSGSGGLEGLPEERIPEPFVPEIPLDGTTIGTSGQANLVGGLDILAAIIHEILHSMGAEHDGSSVHMMNAVWNIGTKKAFVITSRTACAIASANEVCIGDEAKNCCVKAVPAKQAGQNAAMLTTNTPSRHTLMPQAFRPPSGSVMTLTGMGIAPVLANATCKECSS